MNYLLFKQFVNKYGLNNVATSNVNLNKILEIFMNEKNYREVYMRDDMFTYLAVIVNLQPTDGTHWVIDEFYFDSYGCPPPVNTINHVMND